LGSSKSGTGFKVFNVFDAVLDEEGFLEAGELKLGHAAVQFGEHGSEDVIFFGVCARLREEGRAEQEECGKADGECDPG
jgi:hypothetical protein